MEIRVFNNIFDNEYKSFEYDTSKPLIEQIEEHIEKETYTSTLVECYDAETGKTFYAPMVDDYEDTAVAIIADGKCVDKNFIPTNEELISVVYLPANEHAWTVTGGVFGGIVAGLVLGVMFIGATILTGGAITGLAAGLILGGLGILGGIAGGFIADDLYRKSQGTSSSQKSGKNQLSSPDVRGAVNQSILNSNFPFVIGKHLVSPFVVGNPYTVYSGNLGKDAYIRILYLVGYSPLKLTDLKLDEFMLTYNKNHGNITQNTMISGLLKGYSQSGQPADSGDIVDYWKYNDVEVEIIQQKNEGTVDYGSIYTEAASEQELNANVFYIADKALDEQAQVTYKGVPFPNKFRTNGVFFTESCPREFTINLDFPNSLYKTYTQTTTTETTSSTEPKYASIPLWMCIQWRIYNVNNESSKADGSDFNSWNTVNFGSSYMQTFNTAAQDADKNAHSGNDFDCTNEQLYQSFRDKTLQNFQPASVLAIQDSADSIPQIRLSATVTLTKAQCQQVIADTNPTKSIEVRVIRVSPNYINETDSSSSSTQTVNYGPDSFSDLVKVYTIVTKTFDENALRYEDTLKSVKPLSEADMRKFTLVAIKAKADVSGTIQNQLQQFNCIAESFSPIWDKENHKMLPEGVTNIVKYYGYFDDQDNRVNRSKDAIEREVTKSEYEQARRDGFNWLEVQQGSNFSDVMKNIVFTNPTTHNNRPAYYLNQTAAKYNDNCVASGFMLACVGNQNGPISVGYENINLLSIGEWAEKTDALTDGSVFNAVTTYRGVTYQKGDLVPVHYEANAYIYQGIKQEDLLQKLAVAGRAIWTIDEVGRIKVIMDAPVDYTKGVISAQTCVSSSNTFSWAELPAGLFISFSDENDGYETNQFYCWSDGNKIDNYHGAVEPCSIDYVTNPYQMYSLGRYILACKIQGKEVLTRRIGRSGITFALGDVVLVQSEELLIGETSGRVKEIIEINGRIYGFVTDSTYEYTAELGPDENSVQGVIVHQPGYAGKSNTVTIPLSKPRTVTVVETIIKPDETTVEIERDFTLQKGPTNIVLFGKINGEYGILRSTDDPSPTETIKYNMKIGDIVLFGLIDKIAAPYRIIKIKPEAKGEFTQTLVPYDESLYNYGDELPSFQNYLTPPPVIEPPVSLSEVPTNLQEMNQSSLNAGVLSIMNGNSIGNPSNVVSITAKAYQNNIHINWATVPGNGLNNAIKQYNLEMSRDNGSTWSSLISVFDSSYIYTFNRNTDHYPEANVFSTWKFRVKAENIYGKLSEEWAVTQSVDVSSYGTWTIPPIFVQKEVIDRTVILTALYEGPKRDGNPIELYGTVKTNVLIKRNGNMDEISDGVTFNDYLGVTPDNDWYTPEFELKTTPSETEDTEKNYCHYDSGEKTTAPFVSNTYKISHTLPLIGQNPRLFDKTNTPLNMFSFEATDVTEEPQSPTVGDVIHYLGVSTSDLENGKYYRYSSKVVEQTTVEYWEELISKKIFVPTNYDYKIQMFIEESGSVSNEVEVNAQALCTNIADIVHSHEHYKDLYVEKLSAINANIGLISQGGMGSFEDMMNCWALSDLTAEDSGVAGGVKRGTFRVGDSNEYFRVTPYDDPTSPSGRRYKIELKAGNIELTSTADGGSAMDFTNGTFIYNSDRTGRMKLAPNGIEAQKLVYSEVTPSGNENPSVIGWYELVNGVYVKTLDQTVVPNKTYYEEKWETMSMVTADQNGNMIISNDPTLNPDFGFQVNGDVYHFDDSLNPTAEEVGTGETPSNPQSISTSGNVVSTANDQTVLIDSKSSTGMFEGTVSKNISQFTGTMVFFNKAENLILGNDHLIHSDGTVEAETVPAPLSGYNQAMREQSTVSGFSGTVGEFLGLNETQIQNGIFY